MGRLFGRYILAKVLFVAWCFVILAPLALVNWLLKGHEKLESAAIWVLGPLYIAGGVTAWWLGGTMANYMTEENLMFLDSVKRSLLDLKLKLAFVPIIGAFLTPDEDKTKPDDED